MKYSIDGVMLLNGEKRKFHKEVEAENQNRARELVYIHIGSNHGVRRKNIQMESVKEVK
jgi:ribosomal protein L20A (L18A)